jgi:glycosyltransferase involved in cell wall biosynthesis
MLPGTLRDWIKFYGPFFGPAGFVMNKLLRTGALKYDRIVSDSRWFAEELRGCPAIANKVVFVPNGVDLADFKPVERRAANGEIRLLSVGRLVETKGHRYLIEALSGLVKQYPGIKLDVLGNGQLRDQLVLLANDLGLSAHVRFRPPVSHELMPGMYNEHDFFVLPSLWEGLPVSLIEAMACKLPIVATSIPAIMDVLDAGSATLFPEQNASDLADKIRWAIEHPIDVAEYAERAYEVARMYDWDVTARREIEQA